jgi:diaminopimelate decarboxylase
MTLFELLPSLQRAFTQRLDRAVWPVTTHTDELGRMCVGGVALTDIADEFRTPAYVLDETDFRHRIRCYRAAMPGVEIVYAGKSLLTVAVARWVAEEGCGIDVCSAGELAIALAGGVDPTRIILHGNAKAPDELHDAAAVGVGRIVVDSPIEIAFLAGRVLRRQRVLLRVIPEVDIHGHSAVTTGVIDQKFGFTLGQAVAAIKRILDQRSLDIAGLHCHIGSQVTDAGYYATAIRRMIEVMAEVRDKYGVVLTELNIGGGHGVPYVSGDGALNPYELAHVIDETLSATCSEVHFPRPAMVVEPGRAISARAGVTLYRVLSVKCRPGGRTFVAVDGGMSDSPRVALYGAKYTVALADRHPMTASRPVTVVGRHCEAGDVIARDVDLPSDVRPGDLLAVACTGAYHHSMASNYNMVGRPPLVGVADGQVKELVRRETIADLMSRDRGWAGRL